MSDWSPDEPPPLPKIPDIELEEIIGKGGMGVVYRGRQPYIDRQVAVKLLLPKPNTDQERFRLRFRREARLLAALAHPNIVSCYSAGVNESGDCYLAMEFIEGKSLRAWLREYHTMEPRLALEITAQIAEALDYARQQKLIHRDVKPDNILLQTRTDTNRDGSFMPFNAKLADLGLAMPYDEEAVEAATRLTAEGAITGTPATMAPEQIQSPEAVDWRADVYGLGCTLYHALTGRVAFPQRTIAAIAHAKFHNPPPTPAELLPDLHADICHLVQSMLSILPADRPDYATIILGCRTLASGQPFVRMGQTEFSAQDTIDTGDMLPLVPRHTVPDSSRRMVLPALLLFVPVVTGLWYAWSLSQTQQATTAIPSKSRTVNRERASVSPIKTGVPVTPPPAPILKFAIAEFTHQTPEGTARSATPTLTAGMMGWGNPTGNLQWGQDEDSESTVGLLAAGAGNEFGLIRHPIPAAGTVELTALIGQLEAEAGIGAYFGPDRAAFLTVQDISPGNRLATIRTMEATTTTLSTVRGTKSAVIPSTAILRVQTHGSQIRFGTADRWFNTLESGTTATALSLYARGPAPPGTPSDQTSSGTRVLFQDLTLRQ